MYKQTHVMIDLETLGTHQAQYVSAMHQALTK